MTVLINRVLLGLCGPQAAIKMEDKMTFKCFQNYCHQQPI